MIYNWILRIYNKNNSVKKAFKILDRTELEANNEAMRFIENFRLENDWSLTVADYEELSNLSELD